MSRPLMFRVGGTVILNIWWQIILMASYTAAIVAIHNYVDGFRMNFPQTLIPVLGVVTGLLLVFRTNTAYDRYWEGRKIWSTMTLAIRTLTRCIWVMIKETEGSGSKDVVEKASAINLLLAFSYATKNYLREEYSYDEDDLKELISHIPRFSTPSSNQPLEMQEEDFAETRRRSASRDSAPGTPVVKPPLKKKEGSLTAYDVVTPTNIPIELSYYIASYIKSVKDRDLIDPSTLTVMNNALTMLVDCLTAFERILRTPIPLAYSVHLHQAVWLYLLALPYQLVGVLNWFTIPAVTLASFALLGILGIGWEIENPFGYDANDLPLDDFCKVIQKEIQTIIGRRIPNPDSWMFSENNHPFAPESQLTASELIEHSEEDVRTIMAMTAARLSGRGPTFRDSLKGVTIDASRLSSANANANGETEAMLKRT
ncbi:UPF0187 protein sll1024 isoform X2 [Folsomia candida]|uniref:Uncharacterized protein n=1 Tax=Folsomia candida TaxID=158441 RepID=A0A226CWB4_FOLCA|nr:UPF0187 protein sll1024 isoform X2 [Folsomia candida]OXA37642.1 hypothetical protein Fcan01_27599 [Folsomia candida]